MIQTGKLRWVNSYYGGSTIQFSCLNTNKTVSIPGDLDDTIKCLNEDGWSMCGVSIERNSNVYWFTRTV